MTMVSIRIQGQYAQAFVEIEQFISENGDSDELMANIDRLRAGETVLLGGGAQPPVECFVVGGAA